MDRLKVVHIVPYIGNEASGPAYSVPALCEALHRKGCDVTLVTLKPLPKIIFPFKTKAFSRSNFPHPSFGRSPEMFMYLNKLVDNGYIIHNHSFWMAPNIYAGTIAKKKRALLINAPHGTLSAKALKRAVWKKKIALFLGQKEAINYTKIFHATAEHEVEDVKKYQKNALTFMIPNGIDIPTIEHRNKTEHKILFFGRIHPIKGIENLINAWTKIEKEFPKWSLDIVGIGKEGYVDELKNLIKQLSLSNIEILPPVYGEAKNTLYQSYNLYVLPSFSENFGLTIAEAMTNGVPVITTNATPWGALNAKKAGWCIDVGVEALYNVFKIALALPSSELEAMGRNARAWMQEDYSWDKIADQMMVEYQKIS